MTLSPGQKNLILLHQLTSYLACLTILEIVLLERLIVQLNEASIIVAIKNLILMDGIEMNRQDFRKKYDIKTKYRILGTHYAKHNKTFLAEHEEVVVSSNSLKYEEFLEVRYISFMFHAVFNYHFHYWFFQFARHLGIQPSKFFSHFFKPEQKGNWPKKYILFLNNF